MSLADTLRKHRDKLLDLTLRNKLLNFKPSVRYTIHIESEVESPLEEIFTYVLGEDAGDVPLRHIPDPERDDRSDQRQMPPKKPWIMTKHHADDLDKRCENLVRESSARERDTGVNYLHLTIGMLEWYEDSNSEIRLKAPLLLVPLKIARRANDELSYAVSYDGSAVTVNPCLVERLKKDFGIELPSLEVPEEERELELSAIQRFLEETSALLSAKTLFARWKVQREMVITLLSFAKLSMYRDLDPDAASWLEGQKIDGNPLVGGVLGYGEHAPLDGADFLHDGDVEQHPEADALPLVVEADSSQHVAIAAAHKGNLVIQGPPGTGKSQTITNIIATLIHAGKTVLFVAEKKAALDVVKHNLERAALGDFVLELHGTKASKAEFYENLGQRIGYQPPQKGRPQTRANWRQERAKLNGYAAVLRKPVTGAPEGETFAVLVGKIQQLWMEHGVEPRTDLVPSKVSNEAFSSRNDLLEHCEGTVESELFEEGNPWKDFVAETVSIGFPVAPRLRELCSELEPILEHKDALDELLGVTTTLTLEIALRLSPVALGSFSTPPADIMWDIKGVLCTPARQAVLDGGSSQAARIAEMQRTVRITAEERKFLPESIREGLDAIASLTVVGFTAEQIPIGAIRSLVDGLRELRGVVAEKPELGSLESIQDIKTIRDRLRLLSVAPPAFANDLFAGHFRTECHDNLAIAKEVSARLELVRGELSSVFSMSTQLPSTDEVSTMRQHLVVHGGNFFKRWFSKSYRKPKTVVLGWLSTPKAYRYPAILGDLEQLTVWMTEVSEFGSDSRFAPYFGPLFRELKTDWNRLGAMVGWSARAAHADWDFTGVTAMAKHDARRLHDLESAISPLLDGVLAAHEQIHKLDLLGGADFETLPLTELEHALDSWVNWLDAYIGPLQTHRIGRELTLRDIHQALSAWGEIDKAKAVLARNAALRQCLGTHFAGYESDWNGIKATREWGASLRSGPVPKPWLEALLESDDRRSWNEAVAGVAAMYQYAVRAENVLTDIAKELHDFGPWAIRLNVSDLLENSKDLITKSHLLSKWAAYCRLRADGRQLGLAAFFEAMENDRLDPKDVAKVFRSVEYTRLARTYVKEHPELLHFDYAQHETVRDRFRNSDSDLLKLHRTEVAEQVVSRHVPEGHRGRSAGTSTELALIKHQTREGRRRHIPIRQLMDQASAAVRALKPCFMMSPLAVAQFLPSRLPPFNVVIMDEASQILPEDALGAIARGSRLIVVGDPKQLPPTSFFKKSDGDGDGGVDDDEIEDSVLDLVDARDSFRHGCCLKWHYRSLHPDLIAYSNLEFYGNRLLVFPHVRPRVAGQTVPQVQNPTDLGIEYVYVEDGLYDDGSNEIEADRVVDAIVDHLLSTPKRSLGVVTFNITQKECIEDKLYERSRINPEFRDAFDHANGGDEPLLIRNLENIQGEQRDVIFISCTYGPRVKGGDVAQQFGPINGKAGPRRLNVMFTRSKQRMAIFSSMRPDQVKAAPGEASGRGYLQRFLRFAETGHLDKPVTSNNGGDSDSDFERAVGDFLRGVGYKVDGQVGVAGFFIDLGLRHPHDQGRYFVGVECDGATYHSSKSARDRDRLREEILRKRGWKLCRVWSTDWFHAPDAARKRLLDQVDAILRETSPSI